VLVFMMFFNLLVFEFLSGLEVLSVLSKSFN